MNMKVMVNRSVLVVVLALVFSMSTVLKVRAIDSVGSGLWNAGTTWADSGPFAGSDYTIISPDAVTATKDTVANFAGDSLTINSGATLILGETEGGAHADSETWRMLGTDTFLDGGTIQTHTEQAGAVEHALRQIRQATLIYPRRSSRKRKQ